MGVKIQNEPVTDGDNRASGFTHFPVSAKVGCCAEVGLKR